MYIYIYIYISGEPLVLPALGNQSRASFFPGSLRPSTSADLAHQRGSDLLGAGKMAGFATEPERAPPEVYGFRWIQ